MKRATNSAVMRQSNRRLILDLIRRRLISRAEIAEMTRLTRASVTVIVDGLIASGLVREANVSSGGVGRHPIHLEIVGDARFAGGVNIKRGEIDVGVVSLGGRIASQECFASEGADANELLTRIAASLNAQLRAFPPDAVLGVGVCAPGPLDFVAGIILTPPNCDAWHNIPVCASLSAATGQPVMLENVSNALALEEQFFGQGADCENFLAVQINEGIGAGLIVKEQLYRGAHGLGSELGHTSVEPDGRPCECGNRGCLEKYAAMPALLRDSPYASWKQLAAHSGEPEAERLTRWEARYLACALVNAVNLFDVEKIILLGDVSDGPECLLRALKPLVASRVITRGGGRCVSVTASDTQSFIRTGAMSVLRNFYQG